VSNRIAVVGAGIAGLAAARRLVRAGRDVVVFDKARGVGGRTATRRREADAFDHGAQYFTCRSDDFAQQVDDWCRRGVAASWRVPIRNLAGGKLLALKEQDTRYVGVPSMSALARDLASELSVECGQRIDHIDGSAGRWNLISDSGANFEGFDAIVVATPAPQAVSLLLPAPKLARLAAGIEMLPCHAVMVTFAEPLNLYLGGAFVADPTLAWVARNASKPGRPDGESWVLHSTPEWSALHLEDPADIVATALIAAFTDALGGLALPTLLASAAHCWRFARTGKPLGTPYLWDPTAQLGVCGDWTHGSRVEDAFTSGELLARVMLGELDATLSS